MENHEGTPFKNPLRNHSEIDKERGRFDQVGDNSKFVIRRAHYTWGEDAKKQFADDVDDAYAESLAIEASQLEKARYFFELNDKFGINAPVNFVVGKNEKGDRVIHGIVDTITGVTLDNGRDISDPEMKKDFISKLTDLHAHIVDYIDVKARNHDPALLDIMRPEQYVYGSKPNETLKDIYLVDVDLYTTRDDDDKWYYGAILANLEVLAVGIDTSYWLC